LNFSNKEDQFHTYKSHIKLTEQKNAKEFELQYHYVKNV